MHHMLFTFSTLCKNIFCTATFFENPIPNLITSKTSLHGLVFDMLIMSVLTVSAMKKVDNRSKEVASMGKTCEHTLTVYMRCPELRNVTDTADICVKNVGKLG